MNAWDNDIDNLFKRAADEYPLKTGKGEWYKVEKILYSNQVEPEIQKKITKKTRLTLLIILFVILGSTLSYYSITLLHPSEIMTSSRSTIVEPKKEIVSSEKNLSKEIHNQKELKQNSVNPNLGNINKYPTTSQQVGPKLLAKVDINLLKTDIHSGYINSDNLSLTPVEESDFVSNYFQSGFSIEPIFDLYRPNKLISNSVILDKPKTLAFFKLDSFDTNKKIIENLKEPHKISLKLSPFFQRFYVGFTGSTEFSKVKNSGYTSPGSSFTFIAGYQFNNNISIESGIRRNNLFYKSPGTFYDRSKLNLTSVAEIVNVDGYNRISEIPFLMRYHLPTHSKNSFTLAAGTNLTILHQENYNYLVNRFGKSESIKREYNKTSAKLFTNLIFSAGHESYLGHNTVLSIEPFYRIPIRPTGNGNLYVTGIGANIGLIKYLK